MPDGKRKRGHPLALLALIIGIPLVPAVAVHYLIRVKPPGSNTSPLADEIAVALDRMPVPSGDPVELEYHFDVGDSWIVETRFDSPRDGVDDLPEGAAPDTGFRDELARHGGRFRFAVTAREEGMWRVRIAALEGADARWVGDGVDILWGPLGELEWVDADAVGAGAERGVRALLAEKIGVHVPGWFERPVRDWELFRGPPAAVSFKAVDIMERLHATLGEVSIPPQGGLFHAGLHEDRSGRRGFQWLAYLRRTVTSENWAGRIESVWNGTVWAPADALHLASGEVRLNEVFRLHRDRTTIARADHVIRMRQTATRE